MDRSLNLPWKPLFLAAIVLGLSFPAVRGQAPARKILAGHVPVVVSQLVPIGRCPSTNRLRLAIGLPVRNQQALDAFLQQVYDPASTNYHKYLTPPEYTERFGPTAEDYRAVIKFAGENGLAVTMMHSNRLILDVEGRAADVEHAFQVRLWMYRHPSEPRDFFAPDTEPSVPAGLPVVDIEGLSDFSEARPGAHPAF